MGKLPWWKPEFLVRRGEACLFGFVVCVLMMRPLARLGHSLAQKMVLAVVLCVPAAFLYGSLNSLLFLRLSEPGSEFLDSTLDMGQFVYFMFLTWAAVFLLSGYDQQVREKTLALAEARNFALDAQNRMLRYQINPHFLFNALNALSTLILDRRNDQAEEVVLSLSRFLRSSLDRDLGERIPLAEELRIQQQYLAIERVRFPERLEVREDVPEELLDALVPSLILQPLIENAVKYAVAPSPRPVVVTISARKSGSRLSLTVADDGAAAAGAEDLRLGIGLSNVKRRLETAFPELASFAVRRCPGQGFEVAFSLPLERAV